MLAPDRNFPLMPAKGNPPAEDIIFFRHSLPQIDPALPAREWHLSEEGQKRCRVLAERLASYNPQRIISSLEPKSVPL